MTKTGQQILDRQNDQKGRKLLAARQQSFRLAQHLFILQFSLMVAIPLIAWIAVTISEEGRILVATAILLITIVDVLLLDKIYRAMIKSGSRIAQEFDCYVFRLSPDNLFYQNPEEVEVIEARAARYLKSKKAALIQDWYSSVISSVPFRYSVLICQRTNVSYDRRLRAVYKNTIIGVLSLVLFLMCVVTVSIDQTLSFLFSALFLPAAPMIIWGFREIQRQSDATEEAARLTTYIEGILRGQLISQINDDLAWDEAARIQNAIYLRRAANPLTFPGVYHLKRPDLEKDMHNAAQYWVDEFVQGKN